MNVKRSPLNHLLFGSICSVAFMVLGDLLCTFCDSTMYSLRCGYQNCTWALEIQVHQTVTEWQNSTMLFSAPFPTMCHVSVIPCPWHLTAQKKLTFICRLGDCTNENLGSLAPRLLRSKIIDFVTLLDIECLANENFGFHSSLTNCVTHMRLAVSFNPYVKALKSKFWQYFFGLKLMHCLQRLILW